MAKYRIEIKVSAQKEIGHLPKSDRVLVMKAIDRLGQEPRGFQSIKLTGADLYRCRVGRHRIIYQILDTILVITVVKVAHRKDSYR